MVMSTASTSPVFDKGLANTIAAESRMSYIDGQNGVLEYVGIDIDDLARNSTFEEVVFLLWNFRLPTTKELDEFTTALRAEYELPDWMGEMIGLLPPEKPPMHALRTLVSALASRDPEADEQTPEANERKAMRLLAKTPTLVANFDRHRKGRPLLEADRTKSIASNFLTLLNSEEPTDAMARALDVCLILHADHGFNASTFSALVTISTLSDMYSAVTSAVGTLKGPLHGGANERVMQMLQEIGDVDKVEAFVKDRLERKERIMGFGHRVYKAYDPRATYLKTFAQTLANDTGNQRLFEMSDRIEQVMLEAVSDRGIFPNVDFYSATTYYSIGLEIDLFTPIFAISRTAGWAGHCMEYLQDNKLMRPRCDYTGPHQVPYTPIDRR